MITIPQSLRTEHEEIHEGLTDLKEEILRVSTLLSICPEIWELDLNSSKVLPHGVCVIDARVRVGVDRPKTATRRVVY